MSELASPPSGAPRPTERTAIPSVPSQDRTGPDRAPARGTTAGTVFADRYRLTTRVGTDPAAGAEFWQAEDTVLRRDVAVTVLRRLGADPGDSEHGWAERAEEMVNRALRSGSFEHRGCARLLDVLASGSTTLPRDVLGVAVTEWVPGQSLTDAVSSGLLKPLTAARAVLPLAGAAEAAHLHGLVLGCDHPQRIRITPDGRAQVGFALPRPDTTTADDVRGLGAVLYTLLTARWPLGRADAARAGLTAADRDDHDVPVAPSTRRLGVPVELDTLTSGTLGPDDALGHVHTAASVRALLDQVVEEDDQVALFPPVRDGVPADPQDVWQDSGKPIVPADPKRKRKLALGLVALGVAVLAVLGFVGIQVGALFSDGNGPAIVVGATPVGPSDSPVEPGPGSTDAQVAVANVAVYDTSGDADGAARVARVIDGDPRSGWRTSTYKQQFPAYKPGIGVMLSFASAVQLSDLSIDSTTPGTVVQIRSAPSADADFGDTTLMATQQLDDDTTDIALSGSQPVTHVLVWVTKLAGPEGEKVSELDEIRFHRAVG